MRTHAALFLTAALAVSMSACGASGDENAGADSAQTEEQGGGGSASSEGSAGSADNGAGESDASGSAETAGTQGTGSNILIAYFTAAENSGVDAEASASYSEVDGELIDYAADEQDEDARPALSTHIENLDNYDTIFIGYPKMEYSL